MKSNSKAAAARLSERNGTIDLLKFFFSLCVAALHFNGISNYSNEKFRGGYFAVEFFFIVSGFLFARSISSATDDKVLDITSFSFNFLSKKYASAMRYQLFAVLLSVLGWVFLSNCGFKEVILRLNEAFPSIIFVQMLGAKESSWFFHEWYISSMLIAFTILLPFMLKKRKLMSLFVLPSLSLFLLYIIQWRQGTLNVTTQRYGFIYLGNLRAFADISIGCICFEVYRCGILQKINRVILAFLELFGYCATIIFIIGDFDNELGFTLVFFLALSIAVTFSTGGVFKILNNKICNYLGQISLPLYICHVPLRYYIKHASLSWGYYRELILFMLLSTAVAILCKFIADKSAKELKIKPKMKNERS